MYCISFDIIFNHILATANYLSDSKLTLTNKETTWSREYEVNSLVDKIIAHVTLHVRIQTNFKDIFGIVLQICFI